MIHLATAAVVNAVWDLYAKTEGKPLWQLVTDMTPEELVRCIPFRYISDALTPAEALAILRRNEPAQGRSRGRDARRRIPGLHDLDRLAGLPR
jgi:L-fuconate dehydratase